MAKTTHVCYREFLGYNNVHIFWLRDNDSDETLWVEAFEKGIVTISPRAGIDISEFAERVAGCFNEDSNFGSEVLKAYDCDETATFTGIEFKFNGVMLTVTKENADKAKICNQWEEKREARGMSYLELEALCTTTGAEILRIDKTTEMEFKDEDGKKAWEEYYGFGVRKYARRWAKYMQKLIADGKTVSEIASESSHDCNIENITGFMYGQAVNLLAKSWKYGEELRKWHNEEYGYKGDGVVDPTKLTVNVG